MQEVEKIHLNQMLENLLKNSQMSKNILICTAECHVLIDPRLCLLFCVLLKFGGTKLKFDFIDL